MHSYASVTLSCSAARLSILCRILLRHTKTIELRGLSVNSCFFQGKTEANGLKYHPFQNMSENSATVV